MLRSQNSRDTAAAAGGVWIRGTVAHHADLAVSSFCDVNELFGEVQALANVRTATAPLPATPTSLTCRLVRITATVGEISGGTSARYRVNHAGGCDGKNESGFSGCWKLQNFVICRQKTYWKNSNASSKIGCVKLFLMACLGFVRFAVWPFTFAGKLWELYE